MYTSSPQPEDTGPSAGEEVTGGELSEILVVRLPRAETGSQWADRLAQAAPQCRCGCGGRIEVKPQHRAPTKGIPGYLPGHHPNPFRRKYAEVRAAGLLLLTEACRELGITAKAFRRMEAAGLITPVRRWDGFSGRSFRVLSRAEVKTLRRHLHKPRGDRT